MEEPLQSGAPSENNHSKPAPRPRVAPPAFLWRHAIPLAHDGIAAYLRAMENFNAIAEDFAFLEDWDDRYKYLIDLGRNLPPFPEHARNDANKVKGCASQVWLHVDRENRDGEIALRFAGDSDAHIVKGLVAVLLSLYSGKTAQEIINIDATAQLAPLDLVAHLTPQRSNGLASMIDRIHEIARTLTNAPTG